MKMKRKMPEVLNKETKLTKLIFDQSEDLAEKLKSNEVEGTAEGQKSVWQDEDDDLFGDSSRNKGVFIEKLKQKYETVMGTPSWAKISKEAKSEDETNELIRTVGHIKKVDSIKGLKKDLLAIKKLPRINGKTANEGPLISCVEFHPKLSVAMVAGYSGAVSLFSIGNDVNNKLHSFQMKKWKISAAMFNPEGTKAYIAAVSNHTFCEYDLVKAQPKLLQLPRVVKRPKIFVMASNGKYWAASDGWEEIHIICPSSKELIKSLKHNSTVASVTFSADCEKLYCYCSDGEITVWDLSTFRAMKKFYDFGCVTASCLTTSPCGKLLVTGSGEGIVNIYETENLTTSEPVPFKTINNLTTKITNLKFNATSEILSASSYYYPDAVKLVHLPSYHVFCNYPPQNSNLHHVNTVSFSPGSGYMALGNNKGWAYLYRLLHYKNY